MSPFEHWRHTIDERIRMILPSFVGFKELQHKVDQLAKRVAALEAELRPQGPEDIGLGIVGSGERLPSSSS